MRTLGLIAGAGAYPRLLAESARQREGAALKLVVAAFEGETDPEWVGQAEASRWLRVGQLGKLLSFFQQEGVSEVIMAGQIAPKNLFALWPDLRLLKLLSRVRERNAESLFGALAQEIESEEMRVLPATTFLEHCLPKPGHLFGPKPRRRDWEDLRYGFRVVKETSRLDIGQSIVVRRGTVLAVEAFEGTDLCILRGGELGRGKDLTLVKVSKPRQDMRFDVPVVGPRTLKKAREAGVRWVGVEAGKTLLLEQEVVREACERHRIALVALQEELGFGKDQ